MKTPMPARVSEDVNCDDGSMKKVTNIENVKCGSYPTQVTLPWLFVISNKKMQTILKEKEYYIFWTMNKWLLELKPRKNITYDGKHWKRECWKYCWRRLVQVFEYNGEGNFGELALLYNMPRAATVQVQYHLHSCSLFLQLLFTFFYVCLMSITTFTLWLCHWSLAEALLERVTFNLHAMSLHNLQTSKQLYWTDWVNPKGVFV